MDANKRRFKVEMARRIARSGWRKAQEGGYKNAIMRVQQGKGKEGSIAVK